MGSGFAWTGRCSAAVVLLVLALYLANADTFLAVIDKKGFNAEKAGTRSLLLTDLFQVRVLVAGNF
jgi:hypothetical protein